MNISWLRIAESFLSLYYMKKFIKIETFIIIANVMMNGGLTSRMYF